MTMTDDHTDTGFVLMFHSADEWWHPKAIYHDGVYAAQMRDELNARLADSEARFTIEEVALSPYFALHGLPLFRVEDIDADDPTDQLAYPIDDDSRLTNDPGWSLSELNPAVGERVDHDSMWVFAPDAATAKALARSIVIDSKGSPE